MSVESILEEYTANPVLLPHPICEYAYISPKDIEFSQEVRDACAENLCGMYGKSWSCPPGAGKWQDLRDHFRSYSHAFLFTTKHEISGWSDRAGMDKARHIHTSTERTIEKELLDEGEKIEICGAEGCNLCKECTYPDAPCRYPALLHCSMEATGMNVVKLAKDKNIRYNNGTNTITYFSVIFW